jgi:hypothetical protein
MKSEACEVLDEKERTKYRSGVGKLQYLATWPRPDVQNTMREVSRHMQAPNKTNYEAMIIVMKYGVSTPTRGRKLDPMEQWDSDKDCEFMISGMLDSNFNQCPATRTSGNTTEVNTVPVLTKSIMQETMKLSVTEAELDSATSNVQDMCFVKQIIESMGLKVKLPMILSVDIKE